MRTLIALLGIILVVLVAVLVAVTRHQPDAPERPPVEKLDDAPEEGPRPGRGVIRVGVIAPLSGDHPIEVRALADAAEFAVERANAAGGIDGRRLELVVRDNGMQALGSRRAAEELVAEDVVAVVGGIRSSNARAAAEVLAAADIPFIAVTATHPELTLLGNGVFRVCYSDTAQGRVLADYARHTLDLARAVVLVDTTNSYSPSLAAIFSARFTALGGAVSGTIEYLGKRIDPAIAGAVAGLTPDVIFIPGYSNDIAELTVALRRAGITAPILCGDGGDRLTLGRIEPGVRGTVSYIAHWHPDMAPAETRDEIRAYQESGRVAADSIAPPTLDAFRFLIAALATEPGRNGDLVSALAGIRSLPGCGGPMRFDARGDAIKPLGIITLGAEGDERLAAAVTPETVPIGLLFARTGDAAKVDLAAIQAAGLAATRIDQGPGMAGRVGELIGFDTRSSALGAESAAQAAVAAGVVAVIGPSRSSQAMAAAPILQAAGVPMVSPTASRPGLTAIGNHIFRLCVDDRAQGAILAGFARRAGFASAALLVSDGETYATSLATAFRAAWLADGGRVVLEADYREDASHHDSLIGRLAASGADVVFLPGFSRDSALIISQARKAGIDLPFIGGDGWGPSLMLSYAGEAMEGCFCADFWHPDLPGGQGFVDDFVRFGDPHLVGSLVALTADAVGLLADAINRAAAIGPVALLEALAATRDFEGLTGRISLEPEGDPERGMAILRFGKDRVVLHEPPRR